MIFSSQNLFQTRACVISARKAKHTDVTTMFTYSHANTPLGQSERAYYLSYFTKQFMQCVTLLLIHVDTELQELYLSLLVMGIHCTMWWVRKDMSVDLPKSESIIGAEINLAVCAVSNGVLCCNLAESKSVLKMCISKHCHEVTGFLSWIGTYCISCVVQQRSRVKDLSFLVEYDES